MEATIYAKLLAIQLALKAPKNQYNAFGKYHYRSCEDILEAVKPLCEKQKAVLMLHDEIVFINGRFYVKSTAKLTDIESGETVEVSANAREDESKKGMDGSQITGSASSYARKYALNGLFDIDDTKDADTNEQRIQAKTAQAKYIVKCEVCSNDIQPRGNTSAEQIAAYTKNKYGKALCSSCATKLAEERNHADE